MSSPTKPPISVSTLLVVIKTLVHITSERYLHDVIVNCLKYCRWECSGLNAVWLRHYATTWKVAGSTPDEMNKSYQFTWSFHPR
jgi:hypothetical protein